MNSDPAYPSSSINSVEPLQSGQQRHSPNALRRQTAWVRYGLLGVAGLLVLFGSVAGYQALVESCEDSPPAEGRVLPVETVEIEQVSSYQVSRIYTGEIAAIRNSELGFERGGELVEVMANEGDRKAMQDVVIRATRRVLTTTITTMVGFAPLLISGGPFWQPLSIAIAGGIGGSPFLALYFTPAAYLMFHRRD